MINGLVRYGLQMLRRFFRVVELLIEDPTIFTTFCNRHSFSSGLSKGRNDYTRSVGRPYETIAVEASDLINRETQAVFWILI